MCRLEEQPVQTAPCNCNEVLFLVDDVVHDPLVRVGLRNDGSRLDAFILVHRGVGKRDQGKLVRGLDHLRDRFPLENVEHEPEGDCPNAGFRPEADGVVSALCLLIDPPADELRVAMFTT